MAQILIYSGSEKITPRHHYVFHCIFERIGKIKFSIVHKKPESSTSPWINYSREHHSEALQVLPNGLLSETEIREIFPEVKHHERFIKIFFEEKNAGPIPFDLFSASFWLLSRYEEYIVPLTSITGDVTHRSSMAWQNDFLEIPLVHVWSRELFRLLKLNTSPLPVRVHFPVDMILPEISGKNHENSDSENFNKNILFIIKKSFRFIKNRFFSVQSSEAEGLHFHFFHNLARTHNSISFTFFWNTANEAGNPIALLSRFKSFHIPAKRLNDYANSGILLRGNSDSRNTENELSKFILRLKNIIHSEIKSVRITHGLHLTDAAFGKLIYNGIQNDFSGLYYHAFGFRNSCMVPTPYYDLKNNRITELILHPVAACDSFLFDSGKDVDYIQLLKKYLEEFGGEVNILLHQFHYSDDYAGVKHKEKLIRWIQTIGKTEN